MEESEEVRQRQSVSRNYETIVFRKPNESKPEGEESQVAKDNVSGSAD